MRRAFPKRDERGFTLLEMLLTLTIIASVAAASTIGLSGRLAQLKVSGAVSEIADTLREGQLKALRTGAQTSLVFDRDARTLTLFPEARTKEISDLVRVSFEVDRAYARAGRAEIVFFADGSSTGGRVDLVAGARNYEIEVDWLTGLVRQRRLADEG